MKGWRWQLRHAVARRLPLAIAVGAGAAGGVYLAAVGHALAGRSLGGWEPSSAGVLLTGSPLAALLPWSGLAWAAARSTQVARTLPTAGLMWILACATTLAVLALPLVS